MSWVTISRVLHAHFRHAVVGSTGFTELLKEMKLQDASTRSEFSSDFEARDIEIWPFTGASC